jgi:putative flippase GtrA
MAEGMTLAGTLGEASPAARDRRVRRFLVFTSVGALGIVVQLACLWLLIRFGHLPLLVATAAATELAVLHNFGWHRCWTWRDRPASSAGWLVRLWRFHVANGLVSLLGNVALMAALSGWMRVPYLPANLMAITVCAVGNFFASDDYVFRPTSSTRPRRPRRVRARRLR